MAGLTGGAGKNRSRESSTTNQTQTSTLSDRAAGMFGEGIADAKALTYGRYDPNSRAQYEDPYNEDVINATLGQADRQDAIARNQQRSDMAGAGAFGDDRRGIYEAELDGAQSRDRASLIAGLRDRGFSQATDIARSENDNSNNFQMAIQALLAQLRSNFGNEGTQTLQGTTVGKKTGSGMNLGFTYGGGS